MTRFKILICEQHWILLVQQPDDAWCNGWALAEQIHHAEPNEGLGA